MTTATMSEAHAPAVPPRRPGRFGRVVREILLWIGALLGLASVALAAAALLLGVRPLIFMSGSMEPAIPTGSIALGTETPILEIAVGDVISYSTSSGLRLTHRVVAVDDSSGTRQLTTKGDANDSADVEPVVQARVDRIIWSAPNIGYVVNTALQPQWSFAGGALIGAIVTMGFRRGRNGPSPSDPAQAPAVTSRD